MQEPIVIINPVGIGEIADHYGVARATVNQWRNRHLLPDPDATIGGRPIWSAHRIAHFAEDTGRWKGDGGDTWHLEVDGTGYVGASA